jgi:hypothetical protein
MEHLQELSNAVPEATEAEKKRFLIARKGDFNGALDQLKSYIEWRKECHLDDFDDNKTLGEVQDEADWIHASRAAIMFYEQKNDNVDENKVNDTLKPLPQLANMVTDNGSETFLKSKDGDRILQLLPAKIDANQADAQTYALAIAFYVDKKLDRESMEKIVVSVDVRAGSGWANPPAKNVVPFIKKVVSLLERNYPERLSKCILFPLPSAATILWRMIRVFLDANTASKMIVISGGAGIDDKVSPEKFDNILDEAVHKRMEEIRSKSFTA